MTVGPLSYEMNLRPALPAVRSPYFSHSIYVFYLGVVEL